MIGVAGIDGRHRVVRYSVHFLWLVLVALMLDTFQSGTTRRRGYHLRSISNFQLVYQEEFSMSEEELWSKHCSEVSERDDCGVMVPRCQEKANVEERWRMVESLYFIHAP